MDDLSNEIAWDSYEFYTEQLFNLEQDHLSNMEKVTNVLQGGSYCNKQDHLEIFNKSLEVTAQLIVLYNKQLSSIQDMLITLSDEKDEQLKNRTITSLNVLTQWTNDLRDDTNKYRQDLNKLIKEYEER
jgi:hypothetical protein